MRKKEGGSKEEKPFQMSWETLSLRRESSNVHSEILSCDFFTLLAISSANRPGMLSTVICPDIRPLSPVRRKRNVGESCSRKVIKATGLCVHVGCWMRLSHVGDLIGNEGKKLTEK